MKYFSMFSGIGGFEIGIQRAHKKMDRKRGEIDSLQGFKGKVCRANLDNSQREGEMGICTNSTGAYTCVGFSEIDRYAIQIYQSHFKEHKNYGNARDIIPEEIPDFDLLVGGFPCQSFSIAGKRGGLQDTRGTLFYEIARIAGVKRPRLLLLENVKGLLSHDGGNTFATILSTFDELGYDLQWGVLNSKNFGVPQNRERVFIVGHLRGTSRPKVFPIGEKYQGSNKVQQTTRRKQEGIQSKLPQTESNNACFEGGGGSKGRPSRQPLKFLQRNQKNIEGDYSFTVDGANTGGVKQGAKIRRLTPTECERLQGFPDGWTKEISDSQRYKCLGNAVTTNVIQAIMEKLLKGAL